MPAPVELVALDAETGENVRVTTEMLGRGAELRTFDSELLTVGATPVGPTEATRAPSGERPASQAIVVVLNQPAMLQFDGSEVSTTNGIPLAAGAVWVVDGVTDVSQIRLIRSGGTNADARIMYRR